MAEVSITGKTSLGLYSLSIRSCAILGVLIALAACRSNVAIPVEEFAQPPSEKITLHRVSEGETLYSIAWQYSLNVDKIASLNGLAAPYPIKSGQRLALDSQAASRLGVSQKTYVAKSKKAVSNTRAKVFATSASRVTQWRWPTRGKLLAPYSAKGTRKGLAIAGEKGQSIVATSDGTVVYAGDGLPALGRLLIVRHGGDYLSAYAHNDRLLVSKGQKVAGGQKIAELGNSGTGTKVNQLHFEIRHKGKAVNPLGLLPKTG